MREEVGEQRIVAPRFDTCRGRADKTEVLECEKESRSG